MKTAPSKRTLGALDVVNFLMADVHTGVGPFLAIYLAASLHWNPRDIGIAVSAAGIAGLIAQTPVGAFVGPRRLPMGIFMSRMRHSQRDDCADPPNPVCE
jgi:hypothetical protein